MQGIALHLLSVCRFSRNICSLSCHPWLCMSLKRSVRDSFRAHHFFSMIYLRKCPHGSTFKVVLKGRTLARIGSKRTAHLGGVNTLGRDASCDAIDHRNHPVLLPSLFRISNARQKIQPKTLRCAKRRGSQPAHNPTTQPQHASS